MPRWSSWFAFAGATQMIAGAVVVFAMSGDAAAQTDIQVALNTQSVRAIERRIDMIEKQTLDARMRVVERAMLKMDDTQRMIYGIFGGVAVQLILMGMQIRTQNKRR